MLREDAREVKTAAKASIGGYLLNAQIGKQQLLRSQLHALLLNILYWCLTHALTKTPRKIIHVHMAHLREFTAQQSS